MANVAGGISSALLEVDNVSKAARFTLYDTAGNVITAASGTDNPNAAGLIIHGMNDDTQRAVRVDRMGNQASATYNLLLNDSFASATLSPTRWSTTATTMAAASAVATGLTLNSGSITTTTTGVLIKSIRAFIKGQKAPMFGRTRAKLTPVNNAQAFIGFTDASSATAVGTNYIGYEITTAGVIRPIWVAGGSTIATGSDIRSLLTLTNQYVIDVWLDDDDAYFYVQDTNTGLIVNSQTLTLPMTANRYFAASALNFAFHLFHPTAPATAPQIQVSEVTVGMLDMAATAKPWNHQSAANDHACSVDPFTGAQLANFANSAAATSATLSNTAAGYTTLGGNFQFAAVAGAQTDYALFAYAVPAGRNLNVEGITIDTINTGAAVTTTPTVLQWFLSPNSAAATLATNTFRQHVGMQSFAVGAAIGAQANSVNVSFATPKVTPGGRTFHIGLRMPVGSATASEVFVGSIGVHGYFD